MRRPFCDRLTDEPLEREGSGHDWPLGRPFRALPVVVPLHAVTLTLVSPARVMYELVSVVKVHDCQTPLDGIISGYGFQSGRELGGSHERETRGRPKSFTAAFACPQDSAEPQQ